MTSVDLQHRLVVPSRTPLTATITATLILYEYQCYHHCYTNYYRLLARHLLLSHCHSTFPVRRTRIILIALSRSHHPSLAPDLFIVSVLSHFVYRRYISLPHSHPILSLFTPTSPFPPFFPDFPPLPQSRLRPNHLHHTARRKGLIFIFGVIRAAH